VLGVAFVFASCSWAVDALATPSSRLVYVRTPDALSCGDELALRTAVATRFGYDPFFAWATQTVVVQMSHVDSGYSARVQFVDAGGVAHGTREIASGQKSCDELLAATALAISIALEASEPSPPAPPPAPAPEVVPPPAPAPPAAVSVPTQGPSAEEPTPAPRRWSLSPFVGADLLESVGTAPSPASGLSLYGGLRTGAFSSALELRADAPAAASASDGGSVSSWLLMGALVPCAHVAWASFCAVGEVGTLQAQSSGVSTTHAASTFAAFAGARAGVEVALSSAFSLQMRVDGLFNLHPPTLDLNSVPVWTAPPLAGTLGIGVVGRIP